MRIHNQAERYRGGGDADGGGPKASGKKEEKESHESGGADVTRSVVRSASASGNSGIVSGIVSFSFSGGRVSVCAFAAAFVSERFARG